MPPIYEQTNSQYNFQTNQIPTSICLLIEEDWLEFEICFVHQFFSHTYPVGGQQYSFTVTL